MNKFSMILVFFTVWFLPAHVLFIYYNRGAGAIWFFLFGWIVAGATVEFLNKK